MLDHNDLVYLIDSFLLLFSFPFFDHFITNEVMSWDAYGGSLSSMKQIFM